VLPNVIPFPMPRFPFIVGLIILGGSIFNLVRGWLQARDVMLRPSELKRLAALFVPAVIYVGVIPLIGTYVRRARLAQARLVCLRWALGDCHCGRALSDLRSDVPDFVAARRARGRAGFLRGRRWKISKP
jgi:hypothetical protein